MSETYKYKVIGIIAAILASLYILVPTFFNLKSGGDGVSSGIARFFPKKGINLGLDLRGGLYLEMEVDLDGAIKNRIDVLLSEIERLFSKEEFAGMKLEQISPDRRVRVTLLSSSRTRFLDRLREMFGDVLTPVLASEGEALVSIGGDLILQMTPEYEVHLRDTTLKQAIEAVRNRVDRYGVAEAGIQLQGADRIIVEIPGVKDPDRVIDIIRKTGLLEFRMVDDSIEEAALSGLIQEAREKNGMPEGYSKEIVDQINGALKGKIPADAEVLFELSRDPITKEVVNGIPYLLKKRADVTGDMLRTAQVGIQQNEPHVNLSFNKIGTKNFGDVTKVNVGKKLAIVLDGIVSTAPVIQSAILNGQAQITLGYGSYQSLLKEAEDLALLLREGALPASLAIATKTLIGPSLGADSIKSGIDSMLFASAVIFLFMLGYYKLGGLLANAALLLNILFIFAVLALFQASLTLPGIAGIVLTMGMAVDANVIIFERMREEKKLGKTAKSVVESGYGNAMSAIIDGNLTTLIAGIVLYQFGTGPIKGFATTLMIGIVTTLITAVVVTRVVYDYFIYRRRVNRIII